MRPSCCRSSSRRQADTHARSTRRCSTPRRRRASSSTRTRATNRYHGAAIVSVDADGLIDGWREWQHVDDERERHRDGRTPEEREPQGPPRLGLPPVDPADRQQHHRERQERERRPDRDRRHAEGEGEVAQHEQPDRDPDHDADHREHGAAGTPLGRWRRPQRRHVRRTGRRLLRQEAHSRSISTAPIRGEGPFRGRAGTSPRGSGCPSDRRAP